MTGSRRACFWAVAAVLLVNSCAVEPIEEGWFTLPAQQSIVLAPSQFGLAYESVEINDSAGYTIYGWFIPADNAPATVLISHGALFNRSLLPPYYLLLHDLGYNVMVYDYQGFGDSPGLADLGTLIPDADAALQYVQGMSEPGTERIVLFGVSLGTLPTLAQAARSPDRVVAIVFEGSFVPESLPPWALPLVGVIPLPEVVEKVAAEYPELDPYNYIEHITLPKLFIHSPQDLVTPLFGAKQLYELAPEPKQFVEVSGGHGLPLILDPTYAEHLQTLLDRVVRGENGS
jgi:pimeloyl-ACP methyl ester carboxylesterase